MISILHDSICSPVFRWASWPHPNCPWEQGLEAGTFPSLLERSSNLRMGKESQWHSNLQLYALSLRHSLTAEKKNSVLVQTWVCIWFSSGKTDYIHWLISWQETERKCQASLRREGTKNGKETILCYVFRKCPIKMCPARAGIAGIGIKEDIHCILVALGWKRQDWCRYSHLPHGIRWKRSGGAAVVVQVLLQ